MFVKWLSNRNRYDGNKDPDGSVRSDICFVCKLPIIIPINDATHKGELWVHSKCYERIVALEEEGDQIVLERTIEFYPALDKRGEGYGIRGVRMAFYLKGPRGAVEFLTNTNWHLPHVKKELDETILKRAEFDYLNEIDLDITHHPDPWHVIYHSPVPMYKGQSHATDCCKILGGEPCYSSGTTYYARDMFQALIKRGSDGVWEELQKYYNNIFENNKEGTEYE